MPYIAQSTKFEYKQFHCALQFISMKKQEQHFFMITINHVTIDNKNPFYYEGKNNEMSKNTSIIPDETKIKVID